MFTGMSKRAVHAAQIIDAARPEGAKATGIGVGGYQLDRFPTRGN